MALTLFNAATQGSWEPSPGASLTSPGSRASRPPLRSPATSHHPILGLPTSREPCQGLPSPGHLPPQALRAALGGEGQPEASAQPSPGSAGVIGPPAVGTRACQGRGGNAGSGTYGETGNGQASPHSDPYPTGSEGSERGFSPSAPFPFGMRILRCGAVPSVVGCLAASPGRCPLEVVSISLSRSIPTRLQTSPRVLRGQRPPAGNRWLRDTSEARDARGLLRGPGTFSPCIAQTAPAPLGRNSWTRESSGLEM